MSAPRSVYLDHQATTPLDPAVLEAMLPYFGARFGNPASRTHAWGWTAARAVDEARESVAEGIGAAAREICFTSGATESNNLAILGLARHRYDAGRHLVTCATEHKAVLDPMRHLAARGWEVTVLDVDRHGLLDPAAVAEALRDDTVLVSVMHGNNEIGTLHRLAEIGAACRERDVPFHTDATQALGKEPMDVDEMGIDLLSASAHKMHGPKGAGMLYVRQRRPRIVLEPLLHGGGHERGLRSGTVNVPGAVGLAKALEISLARRAEEQPRIAALRDRLQERLTAELDFVQVHGHPGRRLAANLNLSFDFVEADALLPAMDGIAVSTGSACTSASLEPSHVLRAVGVPEERARGSLRYSVGRGTTDEEVDHAAERTVAAVRRLRALSPRYEMATAGEDPAGAAGARGRSGPHPIESQTP